MLWESTSKILFTRHLEIYSTMYSRSLSYRHKLGEIMQKHKLWESPTGKHKTQCCKDKRWLSCNGNAHHLSFLTSNSSDVLPLSSSWGDMRLNSFSPWLLLAMCTVTVALVCERARDCRQNLGLIVPLPFMELAVHVWEIPCSVSWPQWHHLNTATEESVELWSYRCSTKQLNLSFSQP